MDLQQAIAQLKQVRKNLQRHTPVPSSPKIAQFRKDLIAAIDTVLAELAKERR